ncbi:unnamed protein product [Pseudo-nitzschia multistriata]|uniref:Uncharacterized protein n=1 Tax=Pseudo-nitzschia multistriata TaxID=183589 RepID=A0A448ZFJ0_9STRA|nr:unnamed protein product [Pseudo-nitzschia multistriata]
MSRASQSAVAGRSDGRNDGRNYGKNNGRNNGSHDGASFRGVGAFCGALWTPIAFGASVRRPFLSRSLSVGDCSSSDCSDSDCRDNTSNHDGDDETEAETACASPFSPSASSFFASSADAAAADAHAHARACARACRTQNQRQRQTAGLLQWYCGNADVSDRIGRTMSLLLVTRFLLSVVLAVVAVEGEGADHGAYANTYANA